MGAPQSVSVVDTCDSWNWWHCMTETCPSAHDHRRGKQPKVQCPQGLCQSQATGHVWGCGRQWRGLRNEGSTIIGIVTVPLITLRQRTFPWQRIDAKWAVWE